MKGQYLEGAKQSACWRRDGRFTWIEIFVAPSHLSVTGNKAKSQRLDGFDALLGLSRVIDLVSASRSMKNEVPAHLNTGVKRGDRWLKHEIESFR